MNSEIMHNNQINGNSQKHSLKAFVYTSLLFVLIIVGWIYTSPIFNKRKNDNTSNALNADTSQRLNSIGQSFKTMWSDVTNN